MTFFVFELIVYIRKKVWKWLIDKIRQFPWSQALCSSRPLLACLQLRHDKIMPTALETFSTPIDPVPYSNNQCFRLPGCCKNNGFRLEHWTPGTSVFARKYNFEDVVPSPRDLQHCMVSSSIVDALVDGGFKVYKLTPFKYPR